jgi:hypothetical protein
MSTPSGAIARRSTALAVALVTLSGACGGGGDAATSGPVFVAYARDFQGFESWQSETFNDATADGSTHVAGLRTIYLNRAAPSGATEFPVGTIIVKHTQADGKIFAQVKRGGGYNAAGAVNWEWYELTETAGVVSIRWSGTYPPAGEAYGGDPTGGCNMCHKVDAANDYVIAPGLTLAGIVGGADAGADGDAAPAGQDAEAGVSPSPDGGADVGLSLDSASAESGSGDAAQD